MEGKILYFCPLHPDQILFVKEPNPLLAIIEDRSAICPKCTISYYKWECVAEEA
jgi:hypothetical protein